MHPYFFSRCRSALFVAGLGLLAAGCGREDGSPLGPETGDGNYVHGKELVKQGRDQDALAAFLKVIATRGEDHAPESHLEAGLLYELKVKNPIEAIHHYQKFRELEPGSPDADRVRQRIDATLREFGRTLPLQPLDQQSGELLAAVARLQAENKQLREQLAAAPAGRATRPAGPASATALTPPPSGDSPVRLAPPPPGPLASAGAPTHRHMVAAGDTLTKISIRYFGNNSKVDAIYNANRDVMKDKNTLPKIGTELKIP